jgi:uncharacterized iron-regulated membrane protein
MKKRIKFIFKLHSWIGLFTGLSLLVISLSGSLLVFYEEIDHAFNPDLLRVEVLSEKVPLDQVYTTVRNRYPEAENIRFRHLPATPDQSIEMNVVKGGSYFLIYVNPYTGMIIGERERYTYLMDWLLRLHYSLFAEEAGQIIVAILGLLLIVSLITGILVYRKYIVKVLLFKIPLKLKNWRQGSSELHRIIGVWSLAFNLVIAVTGFYMLYPVLLPSYYAVEEVEMMKKPISLKVSVESLLVKANTTIPGFVPYSISIPSDTITPITIFGRGASPNPISSAYDSYITFDQNSGQTETVYDISKQRATSQLDKAMYPLHFGNYGGILIKIFYSIVGLTPSALSISGFLLWARKMKKKQYLPQKVKT